jgi:hypothetical protein
VGGLYPEKERRNCVNPRLKIQNPKSKTLGNPKSKAQNPKQYQNSNDQNLKLVLKIGILNLEFVWYLVFGIWIFFGFWILSFPSFGILLFCCFGVLEFCYFGIFYYYNLL